MLRTIEEWLNLALWLAAAGHFCVLFASVQVPCRLGWKEDLAKLTAFNRKLMWVHGGFAVYTIFAFGVMSLFLHDEMLRGDRAALSLRFLLDCIGCFASWLISRTTRTGTGRKGLRFVLGTSC